MDEHGLVRARSQAGPSNPSRIGFGAAFAAVRDSAQQAMNDAQLAKRDVAAICAGLAGTGQSGDAQKMRALLATEFAGIPLQICTDLDLALAAVRNGPAIVLVAGTGSAAIGRNEAGQVARVGGHGPMVSDEGSAYDIGRRAVTTALKEFDRTGVDSSLGLRILMEMGSSKWPEIRKRIQAAPDEVFPRLFSVTAAMADNGDSAAQGILRSAAYALAALATSLAERLQITEERFLLVKTGGMIGKCKYFDAQLNERLRVTLPHAQPGAMEMPPAEVGAHLALESLRAAGKARK
jgi:N-acetylglucosamine kinase-like BadF-type ATPase